QPAHEVNEECIGQLRSLHPRPIAPVPGMPANADEPFIALDDDKLLAVLKRLCTGAAPGLSGWTVELIRTLMLNADCMAAIRAVITDIVNGVITGECADLLRASKLLPLRKKGAAPRSKPRPIAIGEPLKRVAESYVMRELLLPHGRFFDRIQLGINEPG